MWLAVAIIGMIGVATGISLLPGGLPQPQPKPAQSAPAAPATMPPAQGESPAK